jgi:hypothetical protein
MVVWVSEFRKELIVMGIISKSKLADALLAAGNL